MATILKREVNESEYYYMSHSYRRGEKVLKKEKYLGKDLPSLEKKNQLWEEFTYEIFEELWEEKVEELKAKFQKVYDSIPLPIKEKNLRSFGIHFTHNTNKIEGSQLTLRNVEEIVNGKKIKGNSDDIVETKAHMETYKDMIKTEKPLSMELICKWHSNIFELTKHNIAGVIRDYPVFIQGSDYEPPYSKIEIETLLENLFEWYNKNKEQYNPVFLAVVMHYRFIAIHPFGDGNGRVTRLLMNYILFKNGYPMCDIRAEDRKGYYRALEKADNKGRDLPFVQWFVKYYLESNKRYLENEV